MGDARRAVFRDIVHEEDAHRPQDNQYPEEEFAYCLNELLPGRLHE